MRTVFHARPTADENLALPHEMTTLGGRSHAVGGLHPGGGYEFPRRVDPGPAGQGRGGAAGCRSLRPVAADG